MKVAAGAWPPYRFGDPEQIDAVKRLPERRRGRTASHKTQRVKSYRVTVYFVGSREYEIQARSEEEAEKKALELADGDEPMDWEVDQLRDAEVVPL